MIVFFYVICLKAILVPHYESLMGILNETRALHHNHTDPFHTTDFNHALLDFPDLHENFQSTTY